MSQTNDTIEVDPAAVDDGDIDGYESSSYGSYESTRTSINHSINEYLYENGRRYHVYFGTDRNILPADEIEKDRLDFYHDIFLIILHGKLHQAPIKAAPERILDIGTGTGIWAIEMADRYPTSEVIGTDLIPIQPPWAPPNCRFEIEDVEEEWPYPPNSFDFIHARQINQGIRDWPKVVSQFYRCTKPGGYAELVEGGSAIFSDDNTMKDDNPCKVYFETLEDAMIKFGRPAAFGERMKERLENAGFLDVQVLKFKQPMGPWPKDKRLKAIGAMMLKHSESGFPAYALAGKIYQILLEPIGGG
ncbi:S-adenosyl-L-methionine-dependent methyltransferase [Trichophaea hybrida]|nr:S-adenosyl-L-methionine-dependent methyltransferase [Trichophaea hybrida]